MKYMVLFLASINLVATGLGLAPDWQSRPLMALTGSLLFGLVAVIDAIEQAAKR